MENEGPFLNSSALSTTAKTGRNISFIVIQGQSKSVIITPESTYKGGGWGGARGT